MSNKEKESNKNIKKQTQIVVPNKKQTKTLVYAIICFLFAFVLYSNTFKHSYVLDDKSVLSGNWVVQKGVKGIPIILKTTYRYGENMVSDNLYRPLSKIMFAIEWQISPNNPHLSHFLNVLFYALSCFLLFIVLRKYMSKIHTLIPLLITLLYAAHPIHTEVVANIKSRDEIMSFFFLMLTLLFLHAWFTKGKWWSLLISLLMFFLSLLSKEGVITMLFLFPIMGWYFTDAKTKTILTVSLLLFIPAILYLYIRHSILIKYNETTIVSIFDNFLIGANDSFTHFATAVMLLGKYLLLLIIPYQLICDYSYNQIPIIGMSNPLFILSIIVFLTLTIYAVINFRKKNPVVFGILFFLFTISIYSNILFHIGTVFGERLVFLPSLGLCIAFVFLIELWMRVGSSNKVRSLFEILKKKPLFTGIFVIIIIVFSFKTHTRAAEWRNETMLYGNDVKLSPNNARMYFYWGSTLFSNAAEEEEESKKTAIMYMAIAQFEKGLLILDDKEAKGYKNNVLKLNPTKAMACCNIGAIYFELKDYEKALEFGKKAICFDTKCSDAYFSVGRTLGELKIYDQSINEFKKCIQLYPENIGAHNNIGVCYQILNKPDSAKIWFEKVHILEQKKNNKN